MTQKFMHSTTRTMYKLLWTSPEKMMASCSFACGNAWKHSVDPGPLQHYREHRDLAAASIAPKILSDFGTDLLRTAHVRAQTHTIASTTSLPCAFATREPGSGMYGDT